MADQARATRESGSTAPLPSARANRTNSSDDANVAGVADSVVDLLRTVRRAKARLLASRGNDVESVTQVLLRTVAAEGPMRASALATSVHSDLSTVSRQTTALVADGLLERRADPVDGRASLLAVTEAGQAVLAEHARAREAFFAQVLAGWDPRELEQFAGLLRRFTAAYDETHTAWLGGRVPHQSPRSTDTEGTTV